MEAIRLKEFGSSREFEVLSPHSQDESGKYQNQQNPIFKQNPILYIL